MKPWNSSRFVLCCKVRGPEFRHGHLSQHCNAEMGRWGDIFATQFGKTDLHWRESWILVIFPEKIVFKDFLTQISINYKKIIFTNIFLKKQVVKLGIYILYIKI